MLALKPFSFVFIEDNSNSNLTHLKGTLTDIGFTIESATSLEKAYLSPSSPDRNKVIVLSSNERTGLMLDIYANIPTILIKDNGYSFVTSNQEINAINFAEIFYHIQHYYTLNNISQKQKQDSNVLLQGVSHEVRSFLNGIYGPMQLLKEKIESKDQYDLYTMIDHSIARLIRFTFKISLITIIQEKTDTPKHEEVDIHAIIQHTLLELNSLKFTDTIKVEIDKEEGAYNILGDIDLMMQCFEAIIERVVLNYGNRTALKIILSQHEDGTFNCSLKFPFEGILDEGKTIGDQIESDFLTDIGFVIAQKILALHHTAINQQITNNREIELTIQFKNFPHE